MENNKIRVVIIDDEPITRMDLREIMEGEGYQVLGEAADGFDAIELCKEHLPDLVLMDICMPLLDGLSTAKVIYEERLADTIVLLTAYSEREYIDGAKECGISGYLVKPIDEKSLVPSIELAVARSREMNRLRKESEKVAKRLENRILIERAKGYLMTCNHMSEPEAYEHIRTISQKKSLSMRRVAEIILTKVGD